MIRDGFLGRNVAENVPQTPPDEDDPVPSSPKAKSACLEVGLERRVRSSASSGQLGRPRSGFRVTGDNAAELFAQRADIPGIDAIVPFSVPLRSRFRNTEERNGLLLHGRRGWGEWSPFDGYEDAVAAVWLDSAVSSACEGAPLARRTCVPVNVTVPAVGPDEAFAIVVASGCRTAKIKVAESGQDLADDVARVASVRAALGQDGRIRVDANGAWTLDEAVRALSQLEEVAGGLEYAEQPCTRLVDLAEVRARTGVRIAADEAIRRDHADPKLVRDAVDIAIIKVQPSGGIRAALLLIESLGLPVVVSSALETSIGLAAGIRLAAALDELPYACGLGTSLLMAADVVQTPLLPENGEITVGRALTAGEALRPDLLPVPRSLEEKLMNRLRRVLRVRAGS